MAIRTKPNVPVHSSAMTMYRLAPLSNSTRGSKMNALAGAPKNAFRLLGHPTGIAPVFLSRTRTHPFNACTMNWVPTPIP